MNTIYKTIEIGGKKPSLEGVEISSWAKELLEKVRYQKNKEEIDLIVVTPADLGFTEYTTTTQVFAKAKEQGYELCPAEVGARLAGNVKDTGWLYIAHEPIADSDGSPRVFRVERYDVGAQWLNTNWAHPQFQWNLDNRIVFRLRKSLSTETLDTSERHSDALSLGELTKRVAKLEEWKDRVIRNFTSTTTD
jgi:hypothetical protein